MQILFPEERAAEAARFKGGLNGRMTFVGETFGQSIWSNFPVSDVPRSGIPFGHLDADQREALMRLLRVMLSPMGYRKVLTIIGSDQKLAEGGTDFAAGIPCYTMGIFGTPSDADPWLVQFGGHHLGLSVMISGGRGGLMPILTGAQPAVYTSNGRPVRALADENDKAFALLATLDAYQRTQAILGSEAVDLSAGPGHDRDTIQPEGLKGSGMNERQREMLFELVSEWAGIVNEDYAAPRLAAIRAGLSDTYFSWRGPTSHQPDRNGAAYFRVQGPELIVEFAPQAPGGDLTMHVHTIYRDPIGDYGRALS